ncbi:tripartite tricarboxylate transporter TctB family protein [Actinoplanes sp. LDG1-06]|uniref:Tripartite tricarboxylate transporter TctB family protein n=1 Tax=Paractinoplanes ovalisporus TaxID=2810368 RepID=A0ABS2AGY3_9ACTN|nr:tripartite tricarboxylate transporter TctB family protein [Actinoplanes ovalisporus]MBM2618623.1 tripartite tricarboxylate transporter TctB family protein [Actinoplanes ovalisporus]
MRQATQSRRTGVVLAAGLLAVGVFLLWSAVTADGDFGAQGPRLAPVVITVAWVVAAAVFLAMQLRPQTDATAEPEIDPETPTEDEENDGDAPAAKAGWLAPGGVLAALAGLAIALEYAGFVVSAALFIVVTARILGSRHLVRDVIVAIVLPVVVYLGFTRLLDIFLPAGVFPL